MGKDVVVFRFTSHARATIGAIACAIMLIAATLSSASAHVHLHAESTASGANTILTFSLAHGCEGSATTKLTIQIPDGINAVAPGINDGWKVEKQAETLATPVTTEDETVTERVSEVVYTANEPLADGYYDEFKLSLTLPDAPVGTVIAFPTIQTCEKGETAWIEVPAQGQSEDDLEAPAPSITITAPEDEGGHSD